jgi:hypothetical protein
VFVLEVAAGRQRGVWIAPKGGNLVHHCIDVAIASAVDHEPSRNITNESGEQQGIDVMNTLSQWFARPPNLAGQNVGWRAAPMSPKLLLLASDGINKKQFISSNRPLACAQETCHLQYLMPRLRVPKLA